MTAIRDRIKELRRVRAGDLAPNPKNWRRHPAKQEAAMRGVLAELGYADALLARETPAGLMLIDGHLRASLDPEQTVPVLVLDVDAAEADYLLATLDPLAAMADRDAEAIADLLGDVRTGEDAVRDLLESVGGPMPAAGLTDADDAPPLPSSAASQRGEVWICGDHRLMCGDSTNSRDLARLMAGEKATVLLTDPPYGIGIVRGKVGEGEGAIGGAKPFGRVRQRGGKSSGVLLGRVSQPGGNSIVEPNVYPVITGDDTPFEPEHLLDCADTLIIFGANHFASRLPDSKGWIVWDKGVAPDSSFSDAELIWTNQDSHVRMYRHVWSGLVRAGSREVEGLKRWHPTQKPVGLIEAILVDFSKLGDKVSDLYLGSGTTMIAAERLGRRCYGMEIEPLYVDVAVRRWEEFTGRKAVLE
jgi:hypothetical protein